MARLCRFAELLFDSYLNFSDSLRIKLQEALTRILDSIELEINQLHGKSLKERSQQPFLDWLQENLIQRQRQIITASSMVWSVQHIANMTKMAVVVLPSYLKLSNLVQDYSLTIETDIHLVRPEAKETGDLKQLLCEIEEEMKALNYWTEEKPNPYDLDDYRFLFPDRYIQYVFIPRELSRINRNDQSEEGLHAVLAMRDGTITEFMSIPKARRLFDLLLRYTTNAARHLPNKNTNIYDFNKRRLDAWLVTIDQQTVDLAFEKSHEGARSSVSDFLLYGLFDRDRSSLFGHGQTSRVACALEPAQKGKDFKFFVIGTDDIPSMRHHFPQYQIDSAKSRF